MAAVTAAVSTAIFQVPAHSSEVQAQLSRDSIFLEESVDLILRVEDAPASSEGPELAPLAQDFHILNRSVQTQITLRDSKQQATRIWTIEIQPKRLGQLTVPPIVVDGRSSAPLNVEVLEFRSPSSVLGEDVHLEVLADQTAPYVQSQITVKVRLYLGERLESGELTDPQAHNAVVQRLGQDRNFTVHRNGRDYQVVERTFAVFPELSGDLTLSQIQFTGVILVVDQYGAVRNLRKHITAKPLSLQVRPKPRSFSGTTWLPAKDLRITDSWSSSMPDFSAGKPENRQISIIADGVRAIQIPSAEYAENDTVRIYGSQPKLNTAERNDRIIGEMAEDFVIVPQQIDTLNIPAFRIVWWDIDEDREKVAELPGAQIALQGSGVSIADQPKTPTESSALPATVVSGSTEPEVGGNIWKPLSGALAALWAATLCAVFAHRRRSRRHRPQVQIDQEQVQRFSRVRSDVRRACENGDAAASAKALIAWGKMLWPERPPVNLIALAQRAPSSALREQLRELDRSLYAKLPDDWSGIELWEEICRLNLRVERQFEHARPGFFEKRRSRLATLWPQGGSSTQ